MIDIHSHILPDVDDGARGAQDALSMLHAAAAGGVTLQVLTPHMKPGRFDNSAAQLAAGFAAFAESARASGCDIGLRLAAEVHVGPHVVALARAGTLPFLGECDARKTLLLEFPLTTPPAGSINLIDWLLDNDILPVIAHPERCREWQQHPDRLAPYLERGCALQVTGSSLLGGFGQDAQTTAIRLIERDAVAAVASDCHNPRYRPPDLHIARDWLAQTFDSVTAATLTERGPARLLGLAAAH